ncbi:Fe-S oxidoreductase [Alkalispirochaeta odontotermitis]|nr:Fe-S oxidoreductase [Alkalispirochaeta odontotermitis]CAB1078353.1 CoB--CoM heterodisulfide reductase 2 iron-sulfur subunit D (EC [Olavius algarvensis Delta 1 endosymbiont]
MSQNDYSIKEILQLEACTNCCLCADVCPAVSAAEDGQLSGVYRLAELRRIMRSRAGILRRFFGRKAPTEAELKKFSETVYRCTLCGRCQETCPSGIMLRDLWFSLRQDLVHSDAYPKKVDMMRENVAESHNVFDEDNEERADWVEDLREPPDHGYIKDKAEVVYFTGCVAAYFPMAQQIPMALSAVFEAGAVDFTLLGEDEWCCGFPLLGAGLRDHLRDNIEHNIEAVKAKGAGKVVFACPSCYQMWREHYPHDFEIYHVSQYLNQLIRSDRLQLKNLDLTATFHDPCDLGRGSQEYDAPREVIRAIPGVKLVEMAHNRENCLCCGGGGNLEMIDAGLSGEIAKAKIEEVLATGAEVVVTACQQCVRTMATYTRRNKIKLEVMDIVQLVQRAID